MRQNIKKYLLIIGFAIVSCFTLLGTNQNSSSTRTAQAAAYSPVYTPSADPLKILGLYMTPGYTVQPTDQYTYLNNPVTLNSDVFTYFWDINILAPYKYQWMMSKDGINWGDPSDLNSASITLPADQVGTRYYQSTYVRNSLITGKSGYYSKVATVTVLPEPVNATKVNVTADEDYLYNNQENAATTSVHAQLDPFNSTSNVTWSIKGDGSDLATIDKDSGLVTANKNGKSGTITVVATVHNADNTTVTGSTDIQIGGGLDDQTVNEGKTAEFSIGGKFSAQPDSIVWHKIINNNDTVISGADQMSYTTPSTTYDDNGAQYYAVVKITQEGANGNPQTSTITTNKAQLTVIPDTVPRVLLNSTIFNNTYDDHNNDNTEINNVISGDHITIKGTATDDNKNSKMTSASIKVKLPKDIDTDENGRAVVSDVKIDGQATDNYYVVTSSSGDGTATINFFDIDFSQNKTHDYELSFKTTNQGNSDFVTVPTLNGVDKDEQDIDGTYEGNSLTMHLTDGKLAANAGDLDYGTLKYSDIATPQTGTINGETSANVLTVTDNRRDKTPASVYVSQSTPFTTSDGSKELPAQLRFYDSDGNYQIIGNDNTLVSKSADGQPLASVKNSTDYGIKLYVLNGASQYGQFSSTVEWTFQNAPN